MQNTAQRFDDENALMSSCFFNLEDDIMEYERHAARMHLLRNSSSIEAIALLNSVAETERTLRTSEDVEVLDTVIETQGLLQQTVSRSDPPLPLLCSSSAACLLTVVVRSLSHYSRCPLSLIS
jgi:hypothetical protein